MVSVTPREWVGKGGKRRRAFRVSWYDASGKRHAKQFKTFGEADAARRAVERAREDHREPALETATVVTVRQAGERWVRHVERELRRSRSTWSHYEQQLRDHICPAQIEHRGITMAFGDLDVASVTTPDCQALKNSLLEKLGVKMARRMMTVARMLFNDVAARGEIAANPAMAAKVKRVDRGEDEVRIPQHDEMRVLLKATATPAPAPPSFTEAWIIVDVFSGLRPSEMRGLAIEDLKLDGPSPGLTVNRRADEWRQLGPVKTKGSRRFVPLPPKAVELLKRWLLVVPRKKIDAKGNLLWDGVADPDPKHRGRRIHLVFPTSDATVQTLANIFNRCWVPAMIKAGLVDWVAITDAVGAPKIDAATGAPLRRARSRYPLNTLRHFNASVLIDEGLDPKTVQQRMGHASIKVTFDHYGHLFARRAADASAITAIEQKLLG